jgi:hypothetical protein
MYMGSNLGGTKSVNESIETDINGNPIPKNMRGMTIKPTGVVSGRVPIQPVQIQPVNFSSGLPTSYQYFN